MSTQFDTLPQKNDMIDSEKKMHPVWIRWFNGVLAKIFGKINDFEQGRQL